MTRNNFLTKLATLLALFVSPAAHVSICSASVVQDAPAERKGGERMIYRDAETGRTIWRMTVSKTNDKHCYYSEQPWNPEMTKILWSVGQRTALSKTGAIWVMDEHMPAFDSEDGASTTLAPPPDRRPRQDANLSRPTFLARREITDLVRHGRRADAAISSVLPKQIRMLPPRLAAKNRREAQSLDGGTALPFASRG